MLPSDGVEEIALQERESLSTRSPTHARTHARSPAVEAALNRRPAQPGPWGAVVEHQLRNQEARFLARAHVQGRMSVLVLDLLKHL